MADVTIKYKSSTIAEMSGTATKTLKTAGTYCEGDITVECTPSSDAQYRKWNVTITSGVPSSGAELTLVMDNWLKENRTNPNLCIVVVPKFTIQGDTNIQGVFLNTNMPLVKDGDNITLYGLSAYKHSGGAIAARMRKYNLTSANDVGDLGIKSDGRLYAVAYGDYDFAVGEYAVVAFIV